MLAFQQCFGQGQLLPWRKPQQSTILLIRTRPGKPIALVVAVENEHQDTGTGAEESLHQRVPCNIARVSRGGRHSILKVH